MAYILSRIVWAIPVLAAILVISFFVTRLVPGDPVLALVGDFPAPEKYIEEIRHSFGLDKPIYVQLVKYVSAIMTGDLGFSFVNRQRILTLVADRAINTLLLMIPSLVLSSVLGVVLALFSARSPGGIFDKALTFVSALGYSVPAFWLGQVLIIAFAVELRLLPAQGMLSLRGLEPGLPTIWDFIVHWTLPGSATTLFYMAVVARVARTSLRETLGQDFVITAQAKGVEDRTVLRRHVLPNSLIPVVTVIGYNFGYAITGTIMIEAVFGWPGIGGLFMSSINTRDYPVLQAIFLLTAVTVVLVNIVTDLLYGLIDPRVRHA